MLLKRELNVGILNLAIKTLVIQGTFSSSTQPTSTLFKLQFADPPITSPPGEISALADPNKEVGCLNGCNCSLPHE